MVAFLNYAGGGIIYLGIDNNGNTIGISEPDETQLQIKDRLKNNITPSCLGLFDVVKKQKEDKDIIKLIVASGQERPYYIKKYGLWVKGAFIRVGSASEPMSARMIEDLFAKRTRNNIEKIKSPRQDLKFQQLQIYYNTEGKTLNEQFAKNLELLNEDGQYNYVAYLMADNNTTSVKVAKYSGSDRVDLIQSEEYGFGSLLRATKQVLDKIELENKTFTKITSKQRLEKRQWNAVALREAIINAIVHNDYTYELAPKFEFFSDRFEITSYGGLPQGL
ncbi:MAG: putative DNA binding domain-containing protein [Saprospiraceae bacterium]|nr:putative DNA binding domain-containing protein [Saprospiraceae bacterium]